MKARQKGLGLGTSGDGVQQRLSPRVSWLESEGGAQRAFPSRVQPSARGGGAPETLVISVRMGRSSLGAGKGEVTRRPQAGGWGQTARRCTGSSGEPEVAQRGLPGTWEQGPA